MVKIADLVTFTEEILNGKLHFFAVRIVIYSLAISKVAVNSIEFWLHLQEHLKPVIKSKEISPWPTAHSGKFE